MDQEASALAKCQSFVGAGYYAVVSSTGEALKGPTPQQGRQAGSHRGAGAQSDTGCVECRLAEGVW